jgi:hypothetical protein
MAAVQCILFDLVRYGSTTTVIRVKAPRENDLWDAMTSHSGLGEILGLPGISSEVLYESFVPHRNKTYSTPTRIGSYSLLKPSSTRKHNLMPSKILKSTATSVNEATNQASNQQHLPRRRCAVVHHSSFSLRRQAYRPLRL